MCFAGPDLIRDLDVGLAKRSRIKSGTGDLAPRAAQRVPVTPEMVAQEINRHADKSDEAAMVREYGRQEEAKRRYLEGKGRSLRFPVPDLKGRE